MSCARRMPMRGSRGSISPRRAACRGCSASSPRPISPPTGSAPHESTIRASAPTARRCSARAASGPGARARALCRRSRSRWSWPRASTQAKDAAELIEIDYEPLPAVTATDGGAAARRAAGLGRMPRQRLARLRDRQQGRGRCRFRRAPRMWCAGAMSSPASTRSSWSRAARSASTTPRDERFTLYADVQYPHRVRQMLANRIFKMPEQPDPRRRRRCRRRLRHQGLAICRAPPGAVGGAQARPPGQMALRAQRGDARRRAWPRRHRRCRAGARHGTASSSASSVRTISNIGAYLSSDRNLLATFTSLGAVVGVYAIPAALCASDGRRSPTPTRPRPIAAPAGPRRSTSSSA